MYFPHIGSQDANLCNLDFVFHLSKTDFYVNTYRTTSPIFNSFYFYLKNMAKHKQVKSHLYSDKCKKS